MNHLSRIIEDRQVVFQSFICVVDDDILTMTVLDEPMGISFYTKTTVWFETNIFSNVKDLITSG